MHLGHTAYAISDLDKTIEFYCYGLGFQKLFTIKNDDGEPSMVYVKVNEREFIEFFPTKEAIPVNGSYKHLCLHTDDIENELANLKTRGIIPDGPVAKGKSGSLQAWLTDPDGNRIELMQLMPDSLHLLS
jgi:lactoylglutathione lyase